MIKTKDMTLAAIFVAVISIGAQITIPLPYVPFTLQVFTVALSAYILTRRQLILTMTVYLILGLIGIPIFAGFSSGLMKPTFGFVLGFLPFGLLLKKSKTLALLVLYTLGLIYLTLYFHFILKLEIKLWKIIVSYGLIFIPTDLIAIYFAQLISKRRFF